MTHTHTARDTYARLRHIADTKPYLAIPRPIHKLLIERGIPPSGRAIYHELYALCMTRQETTTRISRKKLFLRAGVSESAGSRNLRKLEDANLVFTEAVNTAAGQRANRYTLTFSESVLADMESADSRALPKDSDFVGGARGNTAPSPALPAEQDDMPDGETSDASPLPSEPDSDSDKPNDQDGADLGSVTGSATPVVANNHSADSEAEVDGCVWPDHVGQGLRGPALARARMDYLKTLPPDEQKQMHQLVDRYKRDLLAREQAQVQEQNRRAREREQAAKVESGALPGRKPIGSPLTDEQRRSLARELPPHIDDAMYEAICLDLECGWHSKRLASHEHRINSVLKLVKSNRYKLPFNFEPLGRYSLNIDRQDGVHFDQGATPKMPTPGTQNENPIGNLPPNNLH